MLCCHLPFPDLLLPGLPHCPCPARHRSTPSLRPPSCASVRWSLELFSPGHTRDKGMKISYITSD